MIWVVPAILNPFADAARNVFSKKASKQVNPILISSANNFIPLILFSPVLFFIQLKFSTEFWFYLSITSFINFFAAILYQKSIASGDISQVAPMLSFTPLFLLITSPLLINEFPSILGLLGVLFIVIGSYFLSYSNGVGFFTPFKNLVKNKGTRYMFIVAFLWSISSIYDKKSILVSSVFQHIVFVNLFVWLSVTVYGLIKKAISKEQIIIQRKNLFLVGFFTSIGFALHMTALSLIYVAYVIALKRLAGLISVVFGYYFLDEKNIKNKFIGALIMFTGVILILFSA